VFDRLRKTQEFTVMSKAHKRRRRLNDLTNVGMQR